MNRKSNFAFGIVLACSLSIMLLGSQMVLATPNKNIKVNGAVFSDDFYFDGPYANPRIGNPAHIQAIAVWIDGAFVGSGSFHGINCHVTFFYDLKGTIENGVLTLSGTVTDTNTPYNSWIGTPVKITTDLSGNNMHFTVANGAADFVGEGTVVQ